MAIFNALLNLRELKELYSGKPVCVCPLYKGSIGASKSFEATGNPVVIPEYISLEKLAIEFSPKQAGSGDPSPENVRPISGLDSVQVTRCGKNLINAAKYYGKPNRWTYNGNTWVGLNPHYYFLVLGPVYLQSGNITISLNVDSEYNTMRVLVSKNGDQASSDTIVNAITSTGDFTGTYSVPEAGVYYVKFVDYNDHPGNVVTLSNIQIEVGSTPTAYEPYQGETSTLTLPETIYGGTVDAVTGIGEKTWGYIASYNGEALPGEWISDRDVYSAGTTPTAGAQVAYKLATPEPFNVSQVSIPSLKGENTIFTNGENMDIIYKESSFWSDEA